MPSSKLEKGKQKKVNRTCQISRLHNNSSIAVFIKPTLIWSRPACHLVSVNRTSLIVFIARLDEFQDVSALCGQHYSFIVASDHRGSYKSQRNSIMQMRCNSNSNSESCTFLFVMSHLFRTETLWWSSLIWSRDLHHPVLPWTIGEHRWTSQCGTSLGHNRIYHHSRETTNTMVRGFLPRY